VSECAFGANFQLLTWLPQRAPETSMLSHGTIHYSPPSTDSQLPQIFTQDARRRSVCPLVARAALHLTSVIWGDINSRDDLDEANLSLNDYRLTQVAHHAPPSANPGVLSILLTCHHSFTPSEPAPNVLVTATGPASAPPTPRVDASPMPRSARAVPPMWARHCGHTRARRWTSATVSSNSTLPTRARSAMLMRSNVGVRMGAKTSKKGLRKAT